MALWSKKMVFSIILVLFKVMMRSGQIIMDIGQKDIMIWFVEIFMWMLLQGS